MKVSTYYSVCFRISEVMMEAEDIKSSISKETEKVEKCYEKLMNSYENFQKKMQQENEALRKAWENMRGLKH